MKTTRKAGGCVRHLVGLGTHVAAGRRDVAVFGLPNVWGEPVPDLLLHIWHFYMICLPLHQFISDYCFDCHLDVGWVAIGGIGLLGVSTFFLFHTVALFFQILVTLFKTMTLSSIHLPKPTPPFNSYFL